MRVSYKQLLVVPDELLTKWSQATKAERHLIPETPDSLRDNLLAAVIAFWGDEAIGFAGLMAAHTRQGHGLWREDCQVIELGGAYIDPAHRGTGIWRRMVELRLDYARLQNWFVVCITGNPTVQQGLAKIGAEPINEPADQDLRQQLCLGCEPASSCEFCPLVDGNSWKLT